MGLRTRRPRGRGGPLEPGEDGLSAAGVVPAAASTCRARPGTASRRSRPPPTAGARSAPTRRPPGIHQGRAGGPERVGGPGGDPAGRRGRGGAAGGPWGGGGVGPPSRRAHRRAPPVPGPGPLPPYDPRPPTTFWTAWAKGGTYPTAAGRSFSSAGALGRTAVACSSRARAATRRGRGRGRSRRRREGPGRGLRGPAKGQTG